MAAKLKLAQSLANQTNQATDLQQNDSKALTAEERAKNKKRSLLKHTLQFKGAPAISPEWRAQAAAYTPVLAFATGLFFAISYIWPPALVISAICGLALAVIGVVHREIAIKHGKKLVKNFIKSPEKWAEHLYTFVHEFTEDVVVGAFADFRATIIVLGLAVCAHLLGIFLNTNITDIVVVAGLGVIVFSRHLNLSEKTKGKILLYAISLARMACPVLMVKKFSCAASRTEGSSGGPSFDFWEFCVCMMIALTSLLTSPDFVKSIEGYSSSSPSSSSNEGGEDDNDDAAPNTAARQKKEKLTVLERLSFVTAVNTCGSVAVILTARFSLPQTDDNSQSDLQYVGFVLKHISAYVIIQQVHWLATSPQTGIVLGVGTAVGALQIAESGSMIPKFLSNLFNDFIEVVWNNVETVYSLWIGMGHAIPTKKDVGRILGLRLFLVAFIVAFKVRTCHWTTLIPLAFAYSIDVTTDLLNVLKYINAEWTKKDTFFDSTMNRISCVLKISVAQEDEVDVKQIEAKED